MEGALNCMAQFIAIPTHYLILVGHNEIDMVNAV